ncbi:hypothetical protein JXO52_13185 [bacterium]|nr:hypothetical protein [bacterium]
MKSVQNEFRDQQYLLREQLSRILYKKPGNYYGIAGKIIHLFGFDLSFTVLHRIPKGKSIKYIIGALRREYEKTDRTVPPGFKNLIDSWTK